MELLSEHTDYTKQLHMWKTARCLYYGGEMLKENAELYLARRQKEPLEVYRERLAASYYENYIGSIIDWYLAALFRREPVILTQGGDQFSQTFLSEFVEDCDRRGTNITEFFRSMLRNAILFGHTHLIIDFPKGEQKLTTKADEAAAGVDKAYLIACTPEQVTNWEYDDTGKLSKVAVRLSHGKASPDGTAATGNSYTIYEYDKQNVRVWEVAEAEDSQEVSRLVSESPHCLAPLSQVPVLRFDLPHGLWLMERAGNVQLEHYNKANALSWALSMGLYATPVVYSDREWNQITGDSYFIQLSPEDRFGWTEPEGKVYQIAADNLERLKSEIFRVCHLSYQSGWNGSSLKQSGLSKQRDFQVTQEVLRAYGDWVKAAVQMVLRTIMAARSEQVGVDVSGMDQFDIGEFSAELNDAERLLSMDIASPTLRKQIHKKLALQFLSDMRQDVKDRIAAEIDAA
jgi:hypothetical protein